jgi:hypothetical protein
VRERKGRGGRRERQQRERVQRGEETHTSEPRKREQVLVRVHAEPKQRRSGTVLFRERAPRGRGCRRGEQRRGAERGAAAAA